ncbi:MAG: hypothetical protein ABIO43_10970 [Sphingomicrobium sp.]
MSEPCFKCGAARTCRHRQVEEIDRSHVRELLDRRRVGSHPAGAHGNLAGPARAKIQRAMKDWDRLTGQSKP